MGYSFPIIGCRHGHIGVFIQEMLALGHLCIGIYETGDRSLASHFSEQYYIPIVDDLAMVISPSVHIVGSSAINNEKIDVIELCEKYNKHVMLDKPAVTNRDGP